MPYCFVSSKNRFSVRTTGVLSRYFKNFLAFTIPSIEIWMRCHTYPTNWKYNHALTNYLIRGEYSRRAFPLVLKKILAPFTYIDQDLPQVTLTTLLTVSLFWSVSQNCKTMQKLLSEAVGVFCKKGVPRNFEKVSGTGVFL